jgi:RNA polymerase sigma-70 factor (ECF subfamily)
MMCFVVAAPFTGRQKDREAVWALLLQRIAKGQTDALAELYDQTSQTLFALAVRILAVEADAEEVMHDVYCRVWRNAKTYDANRGSVYGWLILMTRSLAIDRLRARSRQGTADQLDDSPEPVARSHSPESQLATNQRSVRIRSALRDLPAEQWKLIELAFFDGLTHSELSSRFRLPLGTVKTRIRSGLLQLRRSLEDLKA